MLSDATSCWQPCPHIDLEASQSRFHISFFMSSGKGGSAGAVGADSVSFDIETALEMAPQADQQCISGTDFDVDGGLDNDMVACR